jgi:hypothetical protein
MERIEGVQPQDAGLVTRLAYWFTKRRFGRVLHTVKVTAHNSRLLRAVGSMEGAQAALNSVDPALAALGGIKIATVIGCPF